MPVCLVPKIESKTDRTDPPGQTSLAYTPDGKYLLTAGTNNFIRKFVTASTDEPVTIDTADGNNSAIVASVALLPLPPALCLPAATATNSNGGGGGRTTKSSPARKTAP